MEGKVSPETLENGKVLCYLKLRFLEDIGDQGAMTALLTCLRDSMVWVPCQVQMGEEDLARFQTAKEGDTVTTQEEARLVPDTLRDKRGDLYFPIFSQREQIPEAYGAHFSLISLPALRCLAMAHGTEGAAGLVLDAFTQPLMLPFQVADLLPELPSRLEEGPAGGAE